MVNKGAILILIAISIVSSWAIFEPKSLNKIKRFSSEADFKDYLEKASELAFFERIGWGGVRVFQSRVMFKKAENAEPERVSGTTVQVPGIDEPDIVKTNGCEIYFSRSYFKRHIFTPRRAESIKVIKAFPPSDLSIKANIEENGEMLLLENILVIFSYDKIYGYDISNPKEPQKKWAMELEENNEIVSARLYKDNIYLITKTRINISNPCPVKILSKEGKPFTIPCREIYHPDVVIPVDVTYNVLSFDPNSGEIENTISFVGFSSSSIIYMSENAIYITYYYFSDFIKFFSSFLNEKCQDIIPFSVQNKIRKLIDYDISDRAKLTEIEHILEKYLMSLGNDEKMRIENEINNRREDYFKKHKRKLEKTGIVKIGLEEFKILSSGDIPGRLLNQFSLDEYKGCLRVATTIGERMGFFGMFGQGGESSNDVYVLNKDLQIIGLIKDIGLGERIYSARFIEDKGYIVTFRQTDPFFVLDLSNEEKPELKGKLKIPGYSSYLHPITKDKILGIGREGANVKISLFDVGEPERPNEIAKYTLNEYWSDILTTHHAFLLDEKHEIFFLPGSKGGYVFSYKDNEFNLKKAISGIQARRAIYINDYLYIIGDNKISVIDELNWQKVKELVF